MLSDTIFVLFVLIDSISYKLDCQRFFDVADDDEVAELGGMVAMPMSRLVLLWPLLRYRLFSPLDLMFDLRYQYIDLVLTDLSNKMRQT